MVEQTPVAVNEKKLLVQAAKKKEKKNHAKFVKYKWVQNKVILYIASQSLLQKPKSQEP